jgi:hypothetical protein
MQRCHLLALVLGILLTLALGHAGGRSQSNLLRWEEGKSGCTFSTDDDGKYRYGFWNDQFGIVMAIDADEVRKTSLRIEPLFAIFLSVRYRGEDTLPVDPAQDTLEFVKHYHAVQKAIDPDELTAKLQQNSDAQAQETERQVSKHPEKKEEKESALRVYENNVKQTQEFLKSHSLRPAHLSPAEAEVSGWILFSAKSKWIDDWKKQEQFVLRVPVANQLVEFPFALPPSQGDLLLRRR